MKVGKIKCPLFHLFFIRTRDEAHLPHLTLICWELGEASQYSNSHILCNYDGEVIHSTSNDGNKHDHILYILKQEFSFISLHPGLQRD